MSKWKSQLVSSSLPLEHQTARLLVACDFAVAADYPYLRFSEGTERQFSVDLRAIIETPHIDGAARGCPFDILVECKQRNPNVVWLFLPDPNRRTGATERDILRGVDEFTKWFLVDSTWITRDVPMPTCYKGIEIDQESGKAYDSELRHGLAQLQFALPAILRSRLDVPATSYGLIDNTPILITLLLVTNAPLLVCGEGFDAEAVTRATNVRDVATEVPYLVARSQAGPEFSKHVATQFSGMTQTTKRKGIADAEEHRAAQGMANHYLPSAVARRLETSGEELEALLDVEHVLVCQQTHLAALIEELALTACRVANSATTTMPEWLRNM